MNQPLVSVIVPIYNVEQYIERCIRSIVNQTYTNLEILLIDDGSPDQCPTICDMWAQRDSRIKVVHKPNGGLSSARNAGLDICNGDFISFVDSDDWIESQYYEKLLLLMLKYNAEISCVGRYDVDEETCSKTKGLCPSSTRIITAQEMLGKMLTWNECDLSVCDKLFSSSILENIRFPHGQTSEDVAVTYKLIGAASRILTYNEPFYNYFHRTGSITTSGYSTKNIYILETADRILEYVSDFFPSVLTEAKYFKFKTLLHWNRVYCIQRHPCSIEKSVHHTSLKWLLQNITFIMFLCKYITLKDKVWYILIVCKFKGIIKYLLKKK